MSNSVDPDQTAQIGAVCTGSTLFASILNSSVMLGNHLQQTTSADDIFRFFFLGALTVNNPSKFSRILYEIPRSKDCCIDFGLIVLHRTCLILIGILMQETHCSRNYLYQRTISCI